jgi:hypothetical protein
VLGDFEAGDEIIAPSQIECPGQVDGGEILHRDQQRLLADIGPIDPLCDPDAGIFPFAQPAAASASDIENGIHPEQWRDESAEFPGRGDRTPLDIFEKLVGIFVQVAHCRVPRSMASMMNNGRFFVLR